MNLLHWPVRMHIASVGVSKFCFLFSLAFCGLLLLLLPTLQPASHQVDLPQPRPQIRPTQVPAVPAHAEETDLAAAGLNGSSVGYGGSTETEAIRNDKTGEDSKNSQGGKVGIGLSGSKSHDPLELKDIFIAVKTTRKYHKSRLELLIQTWVSQAKEQVSRPEVVVCCCVNNTVVLIGLDCPQGLSSHNIYKQWLRKLLVKATCICFQQSW